MFEDEGLAGFGPLTLLRHTSLLWWGTKTLLDALVGKIPDATDVGVWGRRELAPVTKEVTGKPYNEKVHGAAFYINARARPTEGVLSLASRMDPFVALWGGEMVAARLDSGVLRPGVVPRSGAAKAARRAEKVAVFGDPLFRGYWDLVQGNGLAIAEQARRFRDSMPLPRNVEARGPSANIMIEAGADVEGQVTRDARLGPVVVENGAGGYGFPLM